MKPSASMRRANPPSFEALCLSEVLGLLPRTAASPATAITPNMIASSVNLVERYRDLGLINLVEMYR